ncbi:MAG: TIGR03905 family TSCPD domain-containing protein [Eubacterium sp.]|nr:TIGR03905 family TSCPD domain-containing protein [Eubacterium sp.]
MTYTYKTFGTCAQQIEFEIDENEIITNVKFLGGCNGNLQGISKLVEGQKIDDVISKLEGIKCGFKSTSCPDQLAKALKEVKENF